MVLEAISQFEQARDQAASYAVTGEVGTKSPESATAARIDLPVVHAMLGHAYAKAGRRSDADKELQILKAASQTRYVAPSDFAIIYIGLGDKEHFLPGWRKAIRIGRNTCCT
jgi:hypothetical protein